MAKTNRKNNNVTRMKDIVRNKAKDVKPGANTISRKLASFWKDQIEQADRANAKWLKRGNTVLKRFRDERNQIENGGERRMNILWANIKILKPALYGRAPTPVVDRKFLQKDPTGRRSSTILERNITSQIECNGYHGNLSRAVLDYLLPGRGVCWVRYEPKIEGGVSLPYSNMSDIEDEIDEILDEEGIKGEGDDEGSEKLEQTGEQVLAERAPVDYIDWKDFYIFPPRARTWEEVQAIGKRVMMARAECEERFGEDIAEDMQPDDSPMGSVTDRIDYNDTAAFKDENERNITVFEIWNKTDGRVYWVSDGYDYLCDVRKDPLKLDKFFPVPEPLSSTLTNDTLTPIPDYFEYQDQAIQIDELTHRIAMLSKACKVAGTYDAQNGALKRLLTETVENQLIPVDQWAMYAEKGGVKGSISLLPIDEIQKAIDTLMKVRSAAMQDLDLITGISDVVRGTTDSRETLGGIRLKNNNAGTRLSDRQNEVARFCRDIVRLIAEVASKHFSKETLVEASGIMYDEDMQPEFIKKELGFDKPPEAPPQQGNPNSPVPYQQMGALPPPPPQPGMPPQAPPQQMGPPQGNNVVPFPQQGMPPQQPPGMGLAQQLPPELIDVLIQKEIEKRIDDAIELLRNDITRNYRIDIEVDSTIYGDSMQERQDATEFITAVTSFMEKGALIVDQEPAAMPLMGRMLQFGVRKFRAGRDLEAAINNFVETMEKKAKDAAENPKPNPEDQKVMMEMEKTKMEIAHQQQMQMQEFQIQQENDLRDAKKAQMEDQRQAQMNQMEMQMLEQKHQMEKDKMQMEMQIKEREFQMKMAELQANVGLKREEHAMQQQSNQNDMMMQQRQQQMDMQTQDKEMEMKDKEIESQERQGEMKNEQMQQQHTLKMKAQKEQATFKNQQMKKQAATKPKPTGKK